MQAVSEPGNRLSIPLQLPIGEVPDVHVGDPAESGSTKLRPNILLTGVRRHQVQASNNARLSGKC